MDFTTLLADVPTDAAAIVTSAGAAGVAVMLAFWLPERGLRFFKKIGNK